MFHTRKCSSFPTTTVVAGIFPGPLEASVSFSVFNILFLGQNQGAEKNAPWTEFRIACLNSMPWFRSIELESV